VAFDITVNGNTATTAFKGLTELNMILNMAQETSLIVIRNQQSDDFELAVNF
jgi:hypothetical protein